MSLNALTLLIACQFVGEVVARAAGWPVPGPVVGLVLLLGLLIARRGPTDGLRGTSLGLLRHLSLLFVPAGVGVITQLDTLRQDWLPITAAILISTALGLGVTGLVMQALSRR